MVQFLGVGSNRSNGYHIRDFTRRFQPTNLFIMLPGWWTQATAIGIERRLARKLSTPYKVASCPRVRSQLQTFRLAAISFQSRHALQSRRI
jgi:hypothetical protein